MRTYTYICIHVMHAYVLHTYTHIHTYAHRQTDGGRDGRTHMHTNIQTYKNTACTHACMNTQITYLHEPTYLYTYIPYLNLSYLELPCVTLPWGTVR